jgi:hypothetical protein
MKRLSALLLALFLTSLSSSALAGPGFEAGIRGMYWFPDLSATAQTVTAGVAETKFDLKDDLGVDDENFRSATTGARHSPRTSSSTARFSRPATTSSPASTST